MADLTSTATTLFAAWGVARITWALLWVLLAAITVTLVWLFRTRWSQVKPWRKCAVLSLWVHVLLACLATTVRIVSGSPGVGEDQPIQVAVLPAEAIVCEHASPESPTEWEQPEDPPVVEPPAVPLPDPEIETAAEDAPQPDDAPIEKLLSDPPSDPAESEPAPPLEAPGLLEAPKPELIDSKPEQSSLTFSLSVWGGCVSNEKSCTPG
ncbi:hypothetical protein OAS39_11780, partial [Pirellulales bacterium]|nr:hypothetical protein [Pirellulales bacterium]